MQRSFDVNILREAIAPYPDIISPSFDFEGWMENRNNILYEEDGSVGFLTYEYPGVYSGHWFFKVRGKEALILARKMLDDLFTNHGAKVVRGLTRVDIKAARGAARKLGFKPYGVMPFPEGDHELLLLTKLDFYEGDTE